MLASKMESGRPPPAPAGRSAASLAAHSSATSSAFLNFVWDLIASSPYSP